MWNEGTILTEFSKIVLKFVHHAADLCAALILGMQLHTFKLITKKSKEHFITIAREFHIANASILGRITVINLLFKDIGAMPGIKEFVGEAREIAYFPYSLSLSVVH